jgi:hypothetical protein
MMQGAVYDLMVANPHEPDGARFTAADFALYREGYDKALETALRVLRAAGQRFELVDRTRRLEARKKRADGAMGNRRDRRGR